MNIHIGCEFKIGKNWKNYDISITAQLEKIFLLRKFIKINSLPYPKEVIYGDISKKVFCKNNEADNIYCSHALEHMTKEGMQKALKNIYFMLKPGGCFRLIVPDLEIRVQKYLKENDCDAFIESIGFGKKKNDKNFIDFLRKLFGNSGHLWMYDNKSMQKNLAEAGFRNIRKSKIGDSGIKVFSEVEEMHRFVDGDFIEVALQCTK
jgi:predicted SAM-dependent methyltransferase